jgi:DNA (cytosine-5)-methyltransferase 1
VIDLFSGAGGMSYGFHAHPRFELVGAADAEIGKPSTGAGAIDCNATYRANIGIDPVFADLGVVSPSELRRSFAEKLGGRPLSVLCACPPCTGFSRTIATNHLVDDPRNSLIVRTAAFVDEFSPAIVFIENARELINGKFSGYYQEFCRRLRRMDYDICGDIYMLTRFGLPQFRERAIIVAVKQPFPLLTLDDLWDGYRARTQATHVRRVIINRPSIESGETHPSDSAHTSPAMTGGINHRRLKAIPHDGGSWADLIDHPEADELLVPGMKRSIENGTLNHFCDVYGRMWWDRPAPTIKRECCHIGNGRYAHPVEDRLCTAREMALLQGFPVGYRFVSRSRKNMYRNIGDAVPPLISYQLAWLADWILTGRKPAMESLLLSGTHLRAADIDEVPAELELFRRAAGRT